MKYSYGVAKLVIGVLEVLGWIVVAIGIVGAVLNFSQYGYLSVLGGISAGASGLLVIVVAQIALAQIATAENTSAMLELMQRDRMAARSPQRADPPVTRAGMTDRV